MPECFALRKGRCTVLVVRKCQGEECPFYKTPEQYAADQQQALERIQALEPERRAYLMGKYHTQKKRSGGIVDECEGLSIEGSSIESDHRP